MRSVLHGALRRSAGTALRRITKRRLGHGKPSAEESDERRSKIERHPPAIA